MAWRGAAGGSGICAILIPAGCRLGPHPPTTTTVKAIVYKRPMDSYAQLAAAAMTEMPDEWCTVQQTYDWIEATHPFYKQQGAPAWKQGIAQQLATRKCFVGAARTTRRAIARPYAYGDTNWEIAMCYQICAGASAS